MRLGRRFCFVIEISVTQIRPVVSIKILIIIFQIFIQILFVIRININFKLIIKILGYFESLRGVFATKLTVLIALTGERDGERVLEIGRLPADAIAAAEAMFPDDLTFKSLRARNPELHANLVEEYS